MANVVNFEIPLRIKARHLTLHPVTIERMFTDCVMDLKEVIVLGGINIIPDNSGFRVRSHDTHGPLRAPGASGQD